MAAIDPDEEPDFDGHDTNKRPRATLKIVRPPAEMDFDESDDEDYEDVDSDEDSDDEELNGGPSDKEKARKLKELAALKEMEEAMDEDDEEEEDSEDGEFDLKAAINKLVKGKAPATDDDDEDDESDEGLELDETVVCTLDTEKVRVVSLLTFSTVLTLPTTEPPAAFGHYHLRGRACFLQGYRYPHHLPDWKLCDSH
jgi:FK506-binding nuclear protein